MFSFALTTDAAVLAVFCHMTLDKASKTNQIVLYKFPFYIHGVCHKLGAFVKRMHCLTPQAMHWLTTTISWANVSSQIVPLCWSTPLPVRLTSCCAEQMAAEQRVCYNSGFSFYKIYQILECYYSVLLLIHIISEAAPTILNVERQFLQNFSHCFRMI